MDVALRPVVGEAPEFLVGHDGEAAGGSDAANLRNELISLYSKHIKSIDDLPSTSDVEASKAELDEKYPNRFSNLFSTGWINKGHAASLKASTRKTSAIDAISRAHNGI